MQYIFGKISIIEIATHPDSYMVFDWDTSTMQMYFNRHLEEIVQVESIRGYCRRLCRFELLITNTGLQSNANLI